MNPSPSRRSSSAARIAALALAGAVLLGVTACSNIPFVSDGSSRPSTSAPSTADAPGDEGQSTVDACALVQDTITQATDEFDNVSAENPGAVVDAMNAAAQRIADASSQITNDEVAALLPSLQAMFERAAEVMAAIARGDVSRLAEVGELGASFQDTSEQFQALCAP